MTSIGHGLLRFISKLAAAAALALIVGIPGAWAATYQYDIGDRMHLLTLQSTRGETRLFTIERPTVVVFWATWSPASMKALEDILTRAPQGGTRWQILPINVDAPSLSTADTARVNQAARDARVVPPFWHDQDLAVSNVLGVFSLPTVIITVLGGAIEELEHDWSPDIRIRVMTLYFGAATDSFPGITTVPASESCRRTATLGRTMWRNGNRAGAVSTLAFVADSCATLPRDIARLAGWVSLSSDSIRRRDEFVQLLESSGPSAWTSCALAGLRMRKGDCAGAMEASRQATAMDSAFFPAWLLLAQPAWECGDTTLANSALERARALNPNEPRVLALRAQVEEHQGHAAVAAGLWRRAVEARLTQRQVAQLGRNW